MNTYTWAEVAKHCTATDLWTVVEGKVLDLTSFAERHPGGLDALLVIGGQEGTDQVRSVHPHVLENVDSLCIGTIAT